MVAGGFSVFRASMLRDLILGMELGDEGLWACINVETLRTRVGLWSIFYDYVHIKEPTK